MQEAIGYAAGSEVPVFSKTYTDTGTLTLTGLRRAPGDCAAMLLYTTDQRSVKNHPIYLYNWFHDAYHADADAPDILSTVQKTAILEYADDWMAGFSDGVVSHVRCGPRGAVALTSYVDGNIRHRDFRN
jgi:hypothetical protein